MREMFSSRIKMRSVLWLLPSIISIAMLTPSYGQTLVGSLTLSPGQNLPRAAAIDSAGGFAYFGNEGIGGGPSAIVVKISLATFTEVGTLTTPLPDISSALVDAANGFAYFGSSDANVVIKVNLSTFTIVDQMKTGGSNEQAVLDSVHGFAYFAGRGGTVSQIRLSNFTLAGSISVTDPTRGLFTANIDPTGGFAYFGTFHNSPTTVFQVRLSDFSLINKVNLKGGIFASTSIIDTVNHFLYYGSSGSPGQIFRISIPDLKRVDTLTLRSGENDLESSVADIGRGFAFFGTDTSPGIVTKINLSTFTEAGSVGLQAGQNLLFEAATIDVTPAFVYFGTFTSPGIIVKIGE